MGHVAWRFAVLASMAALLAPAAAGVTHAEDVVDMPSEIGFEPSDDPNVPPEPDLDPADDPGNWNLYWWATDLPPASLGPVRASVAVGGTSDVCSMSIGQQERTAPPWEFTIMPGPAGAVAIVQCNGVTDSLPFLVQPGLTARGLAVSAKRAKRWVISVSSVVPTESLDVVLQTRKGKRLVGKKLLGTSGTMSVPKSAWRAAKGGRVVVTYPDGQQVRLPVKVTGV